MKNKKKSTLFLVAKFSLMLFCMASALAEESYGLKSNYNPNKIGFCEDKENKQANPGFYQEEKSMDFPLNIPVLAEGKFQMFSDIRTTSDSKDYIQRLKRLFPDLEDQEGTLMINKIAFISKERTNDYYEDIANFVDKNIVEQLVYKSTVTCPFDADSSSIELEKKLDFTVLWKNFSLTLLLKGFPLLIDLNKPQVASSALNMQELLADTASSLTLHPHHAFYFPMETIPTTNPISHIFKSVRTLGKFYTLKDKQQEKTLITIIQVITVNTANPFAVQLAKTCKNKIFKNIFRETAHYIDEHRKLD
ncbi:MAG: hypothetical protein HQK50_10020 [Oligoflexia bacterium]|nr:hypothetical protein [Oligoflexia bacterium]MBF0365897.1 hypothetical protein [Oligoflexia bacterium]